MTQPKRSALALALLVLALALAGVAIALPVNRALELQRALAIGEERLATVRRAIREGTGLAEVSVGSFLISGGSTGRAAAELQRSIDSAARSQNALVRSLNVLTPKRDGELTEISLEVNLQAGTLALRDLVHALETSLPLLIVDEINIRPVTAISVSTPGRPVQLDVSLKVRGFASAKEIQ